MNDDAFTFLRDDGYDPDKFYVASTDKRGHGHTIRILVPQGVMAQLQSLTYSHYIPELRSVPDVLRDAIIHQLHRLSDIVEERDKHMSDELRDRMTELIVESGIDRINNEALKLQEMIDKCRSALFSTDDRERTRMELLEIIDSFPRKEHRMRLMREIG